jgi:hypothetical protein
MELKREWRGWEKAGRSSFLVFRLRIHLKQEAFDDGMGDGGERFLLLKEADFVAVFGDDFRKGFVHALKRLEEDEANDGVGGVVEAELEVAIDDFARAAEKRVRGIGRC